MALLKDFYRRERGVRKEGNNGIATGFVPLKSLSVFMSSK